MCSSLFQPDMLITLLIFLLITNAMTLRREKSILLSRVIFTSLLISSFLAYINLYIRHLGNGIGIYGGLFTITTLTQTFNIFIFLTSAVILTLTFFFPRTSYVKELSSIYYIIFSTLKYYGYTFTFSYKNLEVNNYEFFRIIGFRLTFKILFILCGAVFLITTTDIIYYFGEFTLLFSLHYHHYSSDLLIFIFTSSVHIANYLFLIDEWVLSYTCFNFNTGYLSSLNLINFEAINFSVYINSLSQNFVSLSNILTNYHTESTKYLVYYFDCFNISHCINFYYNVNDIMEWFTIDGFYLKLEAYIIEEISFEVVLILTFISIWYFPKHNSDLTGYLIGLLKKIFCQRFLYPYLAHKSIFFKLFIHSARILPASYSIIKKIYSTQYSIVRPDILINRLNLDYVMVICFTLCAYTLLAIITLLIDTGLGYVFFFAMTLSSIALLYLIYIDKIISVYSPKLRECLIYLFSLIFMVSSIALIVLITKPFLKYVLNIGGSSSKSGYTSGTNVNSTNNSNEPPKLPENDNTLTPNPHDDADDEKKQKIQERLEEFRMQFNAYFEPLEEDVEKENRRKEKETIRKERKKKADSIRRERAKERARERARELSIQKEKKEKDKRDRLARAKEIEEFGSALYEATLKVFENLTSSDNESELESKSKKSKKKKKKKIVRTVKNLE